MKLATKSLYNTMVESEYEMSDESEGSNSDGSLLPSEFDGFSDDEADFAGQKIRLTISIINHFCFNIFLIGFKLLKYEVRYIA